MTSRINLALMAAAAFALLVILFSACRRPAPRAASLRAQAYQKPVQLPFIHERLWLGNVDAAREAARPGSPFAAAVCVASRQTCAYQREGSPHVAFYAFDGDIPDSTQMPRAHFEAFARKAAAWIDEALTSNAGPVLVHCYAGINRSVSAIVAYALLHRGLALEDVLAHVAAQNKTVRQTPILTNPTFLTHLRAMAAR